MPSSSGVIEPADMPPGDGRPGAPEAHPPASGSSGPDHSGDRPPEDAIGTGEPTPDGRGERSFGLLLLPPMLTTFVLRLLIGLTDDVPAVDAAAYLESGRNLWSGEGLTYHGRPQLHFPPLIPTILGGLSKLLGSEQAALVVLTLVSGTLLTALLAVLARRVSGSTTVGVAVAWVAGLSWGLTHLLVRSDGGSALPYSCLLVGAALCVLAARRAESARGLWWLAGGGLCIGLAYLTRPEALFAAAFLGVAVGLWALGGWTAVRHRRVGLRDVRTAAVQVAALALPVLVCVVPYAAWLHSHTGSWQLSAKSQDASIEAWRGVAEGRRSDRDQVLYALDETGLRFDVDTESLVSLAVEDPSGYAGIAWVNLTKLVGSYFTTETRPVLHWTSVPMPLVLVGLWALWRHRRREGVGIALSVAFGPVVTCLVFFTNPRYLVPTTGIIALFAGWGLVDLHERVRGRWRTVLYPAAAIALLLGVVAGFDGPVRWGDPSETVEHRMAAEWLLENAEPDDVVLTRAFLIQYFLDRDVLALPYATLPEIEDYARHYGARWLVADANSFNYRQELIPALLGDGFPPRWLLLEHEFTYQGRLTRIYRIVPPPPPSEDPPIPLGWIADS